MARLRILMLLLLAVDLLLWGLSFTALWQAAHKTARLEKLLDEVAPGEVRPAHKMPMLAFTSNPDETGMVCAVPTKRWLLVPVLGPVMVAKQHQVYARCLLDKINASAKSLSHWRFGSARTVVYVMILTLTLAGRAKLPLRLPETTFTTFIVRLWG